MKKVILAILDGVGYSKKNNGNAFKEADTPNFDYLINKYPYSFLSTSGEDVGLPNGQMGNSEVGHLTIGAGRVHLMPLMRINNAILDGSFFENKEFLKAIDHAKDNNSKLHILGMLSDGGVHSSIEHIFRLIDMAKDNGIENLYLHVFLDGRDTLPNVAMEYLNMLDDYLNKSGVGKVATVSGRYYAMDREGIWDLTKRAYDAICFGIGKSAKDFKSMINECYASLISDEFVPPYVFDKDGIISDNDSLIVANFRPDRLTQLFWAITDNNFPYFNHKYLNNICCVTMMEVDNKIKCSNAFLHDEIKNTLGSVLDYNNYRVLRIAEYSKFPHVTRFFDGDMDIEYLNTDKIKIPRCGALTYDLYPKMSSYEVTNKIKEVIDKYDFILVNYANGDMVGHTGNYKAGLEAIGALDDNLGMLYELAISNDFILVVTADHGNIEEMIDEGNNVLTSHSLNPVYFIICDEGYKLKDGGLKDVAPTILDVLDIDIPKEMTGLSLIDKN